MSTITSTIWPIDPHTRAKHEILQYYLEAWFPILSRRSGRIIYLDGFAGPGLYAGGEEGSPVIAIKTATNHILRSHFRAEIRFVFIESDQSRAAMLKRVLKDHFPALPEKMVYEVVGAEFAPTLEWTLDRLEEEGAKLAPTFAFLDPFGFSDLPMKLIARMLSYEKCEVLVTFMTGFVNRFTDEVREPSLDELYATQEWSTVRGIDGPEARRKFLIDLYKNQLREVGGAKYVRSFEMIGAQNQTLYHLVFGTKHLKGVEVMKEAMWKVDRRGTYRFSDVTDVDQTFLIDYETEDSWVPIASKMVFDRFRGQKVSIQKIYEFIIATTPFVFRKSILKRLEKSTPPMILEVTNRLKRFTYPKGCSIVFAE